MSPFYIETGTKRIRVPVAPDKLTLIKGVKVFQHQTLPYIMSIIPERKNPDSPLLKIPELRIFSNTQKRKGEKGENQTYGCSVQTNQTPINIEIEGKNGQKITGVIIYEAEKPS